MEIIKEGWPNENQVLIEKISITYLQDNDCVEAINDGQELTIETRDGGGGPFLHIKTNGWSVDDTNQLTELVNDFKSRLNL